MHVEEEQGNRARRLLEQLGARLEAGRTWYLAASRNVQLGVLAAAGAAGLLLLSLLTGSGGESATGVSFDVRRGSFEVIVREGGNIEALQSQQIRSSIRGRDGTKILAIVEEGYRVTAEDVAAGKVLVELDSAQLEEQKLNQEIAYETAEAQFIERKAELDIRINQNVANLNSAAQAMKFARLDFEKFLGANVVAEIVKKLDIERRLAESEANNKAVTGVQPENRLEQVAQNRLNRQSRVAAEQPAGPGAPAAGGFDPDNLESLPPQFRARIEQAMAANGGQMPADMLARMQSGRRPGGGAGFGGPAAQTGAALAVSEPIGVTGDGQEPDDLELVDISSLPANTATMLMDEDYMRVRATLDFSVYADETRLEDGEAKQRLRTLQENVRVAEEGYLQALTKLEGQRRLAERDFITPNELEIEESRLLQAESKQDQAKTEMALYTQYTFPKEAEQQLANYENAIMSYQRTKAEGDSELAQALARHKSAERKLNLEAERLADINEQLQLTVIRAERPGLVVYGAAEQSSMPFRGGNNQEPIAEGATVRERQPILTIPDMTEMAVRVNIHESAVERVREGQQVRVRVDAFPDQRLLGQVIKVAVVADSGNAFMNPDMKVYPTLVRINGVQDWLRPGMSAEVEIMVDQLDDVVYVPLQAVTYRDDRQVVYVIEGGRGVPREVEVGTFSEQFIEIRSGLRAGEKVMLLPPRQGLVAVSG
ncbi:MAG: efflux RND transporter periplasmic adaptor subunit [Pseudomonadales bacterium]|nr:efflux RND transporter periplasmic adaptor subunit [Pseudomonadales bacterium]